MCENSIQNSLFLSNWLPLSLPTVGPGACLGCVKLWSAAFDGAIGRWPKLANCSQRGQLHWYTPYTFGEVVEYQTLEGRSVALPGVFPLLGECAPVQTCWCNWFKIRMFGGGNASLVASTSFAKATCWQFLYVILIHWFKDPYVCPIPDNHRA